MLASSLSIVILRFLKDCHGELLFLSECRKSGHLFAICFLGVIEFTCNLLIGLPTILLVFLDESVHDFVVVTLMIQLIETVHLYINLFGHFSIYFFNELF